jgi:predicted NAD/FAD-binding protein
MKIAVVGSGISGLAAAWLLGNRHRVTLFEASAYAGGHTNTVDVTLDGVTHPVDTGFLVYNDLTYPNLIRLFDHLGVVTHRSEMSFSVSLPQENIEWAGASLGTLFAHKRNLLNPRFWRMLQEILSFNIFLVYRPGLSGNGKRKRYKPNWHAVGVFNIIIFKSYYIYT